MKSKIYKILVVVAMLFTMIAVPKMEVKASDEEQATPYYVNVPVSVKKNVYPISESTYPYITIKMSGTIIRGADKNVTSYDVNMYCTINNSDVANWKITYASFTSKSFEKSGTGVIGYYGINIYLESLVDGTDIIVTKSGSLSCGV